MNALVRWAIVLICPAMSAQTWNQFYAEGHRALNARDYSRAEQLLSRAAQGAEKLGAFDPRYGSILGQLGLTLRFEHKAAEAEAVFRRALIIMEKNYGLKSVDAGNLFYDLANAQADQGKYQDAIASYDSALPIFQSWFGPDGAKTAQVTTLAGNCYRRLERFPEAEQILKRAAMLQEASAGVESPELAEALDSLALTYTAENKFHEAERAIRLALTIREHSLGLRSPEVRATLEDYAAMLRKSNRANEAARLQAVSQSIGR